MYFAVFGVIKNEYNKFLAVSRKDNSLDFGLPGGKIEDLEAPEKALFREIKEETGLIPINWIIIHEEFRDEKLFAYFYISKFEGKLNSSESGKLSWLDKQEFANKNNSFREINVKVLDKFI